MAYNMPTFGVVCQKLRFSRQLMNWQFNLYLVLRVGPIRTQNQEPRLFPDLFRRHESNEGLRFDKQASVENHIFRGKSDCLDLCEFSIT